jgi:alpha-D-xyloside xylohydrolase
VRLDPGAYLRLDGQGSLGATGAGVALATATGDVLEATCCGSGTFRLRAGPVSGPDYGIVREHAYPCTVAQSPPGRWTLATEEAALEIVAAPLAIRLSHQGTPVLESATDCNADGSPRWPAIGRLRRGGQWLAAFALASGEPVFGLGEQCGPLDRHGQLVHSRAGTAGAHGGGAHANTPFAWSAAIRPAGAPPAAWGLFVHSPGLVAHSVGHEDWSHRAYAIAVDDDSLDLFLFSAGTPAGILARYTELTGRTPSIPAWSLGLWIAPPADASPETALAAATALRRRGIPFDVVALEHDFATHPGALAAAAAVQGDALHESSTLAGIRAQPARVCGREAPYVTADGPLFAELATLGYLLTDAAGSAYVVRPPVDAQASAPAGRGIVDFTRPEAFDWWRDAHEALFADGVDVVAADECEEVPDDAFAWNGDSGRHLRNVYPLLYQRCLFDATARFARAEDAPPLVCAHAGWAGSQRHPIHACAAAQSDWEGLAASLRGALSWGMSASPFQMLDVGGVFGPEPTVELRLRWLQAAVFASHLRVRDDGRRSPWREGPQAEAVARKWLAFRYRLVPYLRQLAEVATQTGLPVMRAMPLAFPGSAIARRAETQFMCGEALLVAPILAPGGEVEIALPPGGWYDLNSRQRFAGPRLLRYRANLDQFPVFGREGYALPLGPAVAHTGEFDVIFPLDTLWVFGRPTQPLTGFGQAAIGAAADGTLRIDAAPELAVECFGDAAEAPIVRRAVDTAPRHDS